MSVNERLHKQECVSHEQIHIEHHNAFHVSHYVSLIHFPVVDKILECDPVRLVCEPHHSYNERSHYSCQYFFPSLKLWLLFKCDIQRECDEKGPYEQVDDYVLGVCERAHIDFVASGHQNHEHVSEETAEYVAPADQQFVVDTAMALPVDTVQLQTLEAEGK